MSLHDKKCVPCEVKIPPLALAKVADLQQELDPAWSAESNIKIKREFIFKDFKQAMEFVNKVAEIAEDQGHHPDLNISYNKVQIELSTHFIGGLSENDFIVASKIDHI